ncbi:MAG TPA: NAD(P)H-hydrate dehydratase [Bdellovibrionota bacterium]|nr:NAD(P)H-hydrate dehydratase [Bdellovibrionota bacterium]
MLIPAPLRICSASEMKELDEVADRDYGLDASILMENAGRAAAQAIIDRFPNAGKVSEILVFAGTGNNAGDAFVVARRLLCFERRVRIFHLENEAGYKGASLKNFQILKKMRAKMTYLEASSDLEAFFSSSPGPFTIIDGILGTGLRGNLEGIFYDVVEMINALKCHEVVSLDIPSGVSGDTGAIKGTSIMATMTVSFGFPKLGHFLPPGAPRRGELVNLDISLPPRFRKEGDKFLLTKGPMAALLTERDRYGHKNSFGHTLLVGGSPGRIGAITMASRACHKMGTGLVTVATWADCFDTLIGKIPDETMAVSLELNGSQNDAYKRNLPTYSSVVIGPGLGQRPEAKFLVEGLLTHYEGPVLMDADALNVISTHHMHDLLIKRRNPVVLTPHPGEMSRLLGMSVEAIRSDPAKAVRDAVAMTHAIVVLKGAASLIGSADNVLYLNHYPNDGMATAGSGDVLAGMIGGLIGQRMDPFQGTLLGVYLHSFAGDFAAKQFGHRSMTAPDIIENIGNAFKEIKTVPEPTSPVEGRARLL